MSVALAFTTGLLAGGASCAAVQGGLLATSVAQRHPADSPARTAREGVAPASGPPLSRPGLKADATPVLGFLTGKLAAHVALGALLGALGAAVQPGFRARATILIAAGMLMVAFGLSLAGVIPRIQVAPPAAVGRWVRTRSKAGGWWGPGALGAATVLLPCGVTLSMELLAATSGSPAAGAAIMGAFVLGTVPLFAVVGYALRRSARLLQGRLALATAVLVVVSGLVSVNSGLVLSGSSVTAGRAWRALTSAEASTTDSAPGGLFALPDATQLPDGGQAVDITVRDSSYLPSRINARAGVPTVLRLRTSRTRGCTRAFVIPSLGVERVLPESGEVLVDVGVLSPGTLDYTCGMGMYHGAIEVRG